MFRKSGFIIAILILTIVSLASVVCQAAQPQALMTRHVPEVVANGKAKWSGSSRQTSPCALTLLFRCAIRPVWKFSSGTLRSVQPLLPPFYYAGRIYAEVWPQPGRLGRFGEFRESERLSDIQRLPR